MKKKFLYLAALALTTGTLSLVSPVTALAAPEEQAAEEVIDPEEGLDFEKLVSQGPAAVQEALEAAQEAAGVESDAAIAERQNVVNYALQFVGGRYRAGGNDPHTGADCSGFVKYVMQNGAGVSMNRSSAAQAAQGTAVSVDQMQPGDLLFYSKGYSINHVAMYIGDGQIVHASTYSTGIKVSAWNYRDPVKIINVLG